MDELTDLSANLDEKLKKGKFQRLKVW